MRAVVIARQGYGNPRRGIEYVPPGSVIEVPDSMAARLISAQVIAPAPKPAVQTTAKSAPATTTAKRTGKPAKAHAEEEDRAGKKAE